MARRKAKGDGGSGGGSVNSVTGFYVNNTDPANPIVTVPKNNMTAVTSPSVTDDSASQYSVGSIWFNNTRQELWIAQSVGVGVAVWTAQTNLHQAAGAPGVGNDNTQGYQIGSFWFNTATSTLYIAQSVGTGAASWQAVTGSGGVTPTLITIAALKTLIANGTVVPGRTYYITDSTQAAFISVTGKSINSISEEGSGMFYNADFQAVGDYSGVAGFGAQRGQWLVANETGTPYVNGDVVIYNGLHYEVTNDAAFAGTNPSVTPAAYTVLTASVTNGYILVWDPILYDLQDTISGTTHDWITWREDTRGNHVGASWIYEQTQGWGQNVITLFQWGNDSVYANYVSESMCDILNNSFRVSNNEVIAASLLQANLNTGGIADNNISNASYITAGTQAGTISGNTLLNSGSIIADANTGGVTANSCIDGCQINASANNGSITNNGLRNNSNIFGANNQGSINTNDMANSAILASDQLGTGVIEQNTMQGSQMEASNNEGLVRRNVLFGITVGDFDVGSNTGTVDNNICEQNSALIATNNTADITYNRLGGICRLTATSNEGTIIGNILTQESSIDATANLGSIARNTLNSASGIDASAQTADGVIGSNFLSEGVLTATTSSGSCNENSITDRSDLEIGAAGVGSLIEGNILSGRTVVVANAIGGNLNHNIFSNGASIDAQPGAGFTITNCQFSGAITFTINTASNYDSKILEVGRSTFDTTIDISGLDDINFAGFEYCGVITLTSINATEVVRTITNNSNLFDAQFTPIDGLSVTFDATPVATVSAGQIVLEIDTNVTTVGRSTISDFLVLRLDPVTAINRQVTGSII